MPQATITTELVRQLRHQRPSRVTDYRDPKLPGFVLRARATGIHSWRVQLPNRRWLTIGRIDEVALSDARETAQTRRAHAALSQDIPTRRPTSDVTLRAFLDDTYEAWMASAYGKGTTQLERIRSAFRDLLDLKLSELTTARATFPHPIAFAFGGEDRRVMGQAIEQRGRQLLIARKHSDPFSKREIGRDDGRASLVPIRDEIEEELAAHAVERDKAELVDDQHIDTEEPLL